MTLQIRHMQTAVDRMVQQSGGYWRPASAAFNLYEELLALDEATYSVVLDSGQLAPVDNDEIRRHFLKIFVAAMCIATQYSVNLSDAFGDLGLTKDLEDATYWGDNKPDLRKVVLGVKRRVGQVARVVTVYDFEDASADSPELPKIAQAVPKLLVEILRGFESADDLNRYFGANISAPRSPRRFASPFDPGTAPVLETISPIQDRTACPFARRARLWGAPSFDDRLDFEENLHRSIPSLRIFIRVAQREPLDGYVYGIPVRPESHDLDEASELAARLVFFLSKTCNGKSQSQVRQEIQEDEAWKFSVYGEDCFVNVFAPAYPSTHSRSTYSVGDMMFVMLQPESSFHELIPKGEYQIQRDRIRKAFRDIYQGYELDDHEAHRFVLPVDHAGQPVRWYE